MYIFELDIAELSQLCDSVVGYFSVHVELNEGHLLRACDDDEYYIIIR